MTLSRSKPKNDIVHYVINRRWTGTNHRNISYLCISASSTTPTKSTRVVADVTCLNCLRELRKRENR